MVGTGQKGLSQEEAVRQVFMRQGYFAIRSIPISWEGREATDIDVLLFEHAAPFTRVRMSVDVKNKKKSKPFERFIWARGIKEVFGFDQAIVVTSNKSADIGTFAQQAGVIVAAEFSDITTSNRLSEEDFEAALANQDLAGARGGRVQAYRNMKSLLLGPLKFDALNKLLRNLQRSLLRIAEGQTEEGAYRIAYISAAYVCLSMDFLSPSLGSVPRDNQRRLIEDGLRYGDGGRARLSEALSLSRAISAATSSVEEPDLFEESVARLLETQPVDVISEYWMRSINSGALWTIALTFEQFAFGQGPVRPNAMETNMRSALGVFLDYFEIDRKKVLAT